MKQREGMQGRYCLCTNLQGHFRVHSLAACRVLGWGTGADGHKRIWGTEDSFNLTADHLFPLFVGLIHKKPQLFLLST
jgi:hypothetical protein